MPSHPQYSWKWQVGVGGSIIHPDYTPYKTGAGTVYGTYQFLPNFSLDTRAHYTTQNPGDRELTVMSGARFNLPVKRYNPYISGMIGYGHFSYTDKVLVYANDSFIITYAAGIDIRLSKHINIRPIDLEYQRWTNFLPNGLTPTLYTAGIAYHR